VEYVCNERLGRMHCMRLSWPIKVRLIVPLPHDSGKSRVCYRSPMNMFQLRESCEKYKHRREEWPTHCRRAESSPAPLGKKQIDIRRWKSERKEWWRALGAAGGRKENVNRGQRAGATVTTNCGVQKYGTGRDCKAGQVRQSHRVCHKLKALC
jgi:hypothetical protein